MALAKVALLAPPTNVGEIVKILSTLREDDNEDDASGAVVVDGEQL